MMCCMFAEDVATLPLSIDLLCREHQHCCISHAISVHLTQSVQDLNLSSLVIKVWAWSKLRIHTSFLHCLDSNFIPSLSMHKLLHIFYVWIYPSCAKSACVATYYQTQA